MQIYSLCGVYFTTGVLCYFCSFSSKRILNSLFFAWFILASTFNAAKLFSNRLRSTWSSAFLWKKRFYFACVHDIYVVFILQVYQKLISCITTWLVYKQHFIFFSKIQSLEFLTISVIISKKIITLWFFLILENIIFSLL